jgi:hypothetical protein
MLIPGSEPDWNTAYHEAGHAVAAYLLGRRIKFATHEHPVGGCVELSDLAPNQSKRREKDVIVALAGTAAERRFRGGKHNRDGSESDFQAARDLVHDIATRRGEDPATVQRDRLQVALDAAKAIPETHWTAITALAKALVVRRTMSGAAVRRLLRGVDRTP